MPYWAKPPTAFAKIQAYDGTNWQNLLVQSADYKNLRVGVYSDNTQAFVASGGIDSRSNSTPGLATHCFLYGFNGSTWDRLRCDDDKHLKIAHGFLEGYTTGTTTDSYANALNWTNAEKYLHKTIILKNTGDTNSLDYQVLVYAHNDGNAYTETSGSLAAGDVVKIVLNNHYARVVVQVKSSTAGASTSYRIDYCGFKG